MKKKRFQEIRKNKNTWAAETNDMVYYWMHEEPIVTNRKRNSATSFDPPRYLDDLYFSGGSAAEEETDRTMEPADEKETDTSDDPPPPPPLESLPYTSANPCTSRALPPSPRCSIDVMVDAGGLEYGLGVLDDAGAESIFDDEGNVIAPVHGDHHLHSALSGGGPGAELTAGAAGAPAAAEEEHRRGAAAPGASLAAAATHETPTATTTTSTPPTWAHPLTRLDSVEVHKRRLNLQKGAAFSMNPKARPTSVARRFVAPHRYPLRQTR